MKVLKGSDPSPGRSNFLRKTGYEVSSVKSLILKCGFKFIAKHFKDQTKHYLWAECEPRTKSYHNLRKDRF